MQNSLGSTNLLILVVRVLGLKESSLQSQQKAKTALLAPINSISSIHLTQAAMAWYCIIQKNKARLLIKKSQIQEAASQLADSPC